MRVMVPRSHDEKATYREEPVDKEVGHELVNRPKRYFAPAQPERMPHDDAGSKQQPDQIQCVEARVKFRERAANPGSPLGPKRLGITSTHWR